MKTTLRCASLVLLGCWPWSIGATTAPTIDHRRIIAESGGFLKRQEPEMNASEYAVYEKVAPILAARPAFALKLLTAMSTSSDPDEKPSPAFEFMLGNAFYTAGRYAEAEVKYRNAVDRNPAFLRAWNNLGVLYYVQDRHADAVPCFSRSVSLGDRDPTTFGLLGNSLEKTGNTVSAEMAYMQALALDPANISWTEGLLRIYIADKQQSKAESLVRTLVTNHPGEARYWLTYANLLLSCGRRIEATAVVTRMTAAGLATTENVLLSADLYAEQRMIAEAVAAYAKVAGAQPELVEQKLLQLARTLIASKDWVQAPLVLDALSSGAVSPSGRIAVLEAKVDLEIGRGNWPGAKRELTNLLAAAPDNGVAWFGLGRVHLAEAEESKAAEAFERAYRIPKTAYRASIELTNIAFKNRDYPRCLEYLNHALSLQRTTAVENFRDYVRSLLPAENQSTP